MWNLSDGFNAWLTKFQREISGKLNFGFLRINEVASFWEFLIAINPNNLIKWKFDYFYGCKYFLLDGLTMVLK